MTPMELHEVLAFAAKAHAGACYDGRAGPEPYIFHPLRVAMRVPGVYRTVALLHDVVEDTPHTLDELPATPRERAAVALLTRDPAEEYDAYIARIAGAPGWPGMAARAVKIADLEENLGHAGTGDWRKPRYLRALATLEEI